MVYLLETEHFLIREKTTQNIRLPKSSHEESEACGQFIPDAAFKESLPETLIAESRVTGMPVGEITVRTPAAPGQEPVFCCLYGRFRQRRFVKEIVDAVKAIL